MTLVEWVFWATVLVVIYVYFGYPLTLAALPRAKREREEPKLPLLSIIIAAFNEEEHIGASIENKLSLDYPPELREIIVVSDGSTDRTDEIVRSFDPSRVKLLRQEARQGKTMALNRAVEVAKGEIIVFSDANSIYDPGALRRIVEEFRDPRVGYVTGRLSYQNAGKTAIGDGCGLYMRYENLVRSLESRVGSVVGVNGGIDGVRKCLFAPMRADQLPDFILPLHVMEQGYRISFCAEAILYEEALKEAGDELKMRVRVCLRTYHDLWEMRHLLRPKYRLAFFQILVHKIFRYLVFILLPIIFFTNLLLVERWPYRGIMICQLIFYSIAIVGALVHKRLKGGVLLSPFYFCLINFAAGVAFWKFLNGERQVIWTPRKGA